MCRLWRRSSCDTSGASFFSCCWWWGRSELFERARRALPHVGVGPEGGDRHGVDLLLGEEADEGAVELVRNRTRRHAALHREAGCHLGASAVLVDAQLELLERLDDLPGVTGLRGLGDRADHPVQVGAGVQVQHGDLDACGPDLVGAVVRRQELLRRDGQLHPGCGLVGLGQPETAAALGANADQRFVGARIEDSHAGPQVERRVPDALAPVVALDRCDRSAGEPLDQHVKDRHDADPVEGLELRVEAVSLQEVVERAVAVRGECFQVGELADLVPVSVVPGEKRLLLFVEPVPLRFAVVELGQLIGQHVECVTHGRQVERFGRHPVPPYIESIPHSRLTGSLGGTSIARSKLPVTTIT